MAGHSRYSLLADGAGMVDGVLKNKLGITDQQEIDDAETLLLADAYKHFFERLERAKCFLLRRSILKVRVKRSVMF